MPPLATPIHLLDDEKGLHLYTLLKLLLKQFGPEYLAWDSVALRMEVEETWGVPGPLTWERIQAGRVMAGNDAFWIHMEVFENCGLALVGEIPYFAAFQPLEAESVAVILHTATLIKTHPYSDEVLSYAVACCLEDETWFLEPPLDVLQSTLDELDGRQGVVRPVDAVRALLDNGPSVVEDPDAAHQVQVNNVLSVRTTLARYKTSLSDQLKELRL